MKEQYYSDNTIDSVAQDFCHKIIPLRDKHQYRLDPKTLALLVIDCQKFFFNESSHAFIPSSPAILPKILKLQNFCLKHGITVIQTQHLNTPEDAKNMQSWWGDHLLAKGDPLTEIIPELVSPKIPTVVKSQYDAFYESSLEPILKANNIKQLIITGVMTHLCCETTARAAFTRGYELFFSIDGTATYKREFHLGTLINLAHGFAIPMLIDELITQLTTNNL